MKIYVNLCKGVNYGVKHKTSCTTRGSNVVQNKQNPAVTNQINQ